MSETVGSFVDHDKLTSHVKPGDLIEIRRRTYSHWVMCESIDHSGTVWCFHVMPWNKEANKEKNTPDDDPRYKDGDNMEILGLLKYEPLAETVWSAREQRRGKCRVNNQTSVAKKYNVSERRDLESVFKSLHQSDKLLPYNQMSLNCEHYCTQWKYGIGWSTEVSAYMTAVKASAIVMIIGLVLMVNDSCITAFLCLLISFLILMASFVIYHELDLLHRSFFFKY